MALVVEDGTGKSDAESYISVADAETYFAAHGVRSAWTAATGSAKEAALRYATAWLDGYYRWRGEVLNGTQALDWPRINVEDDEYRILPYDEVPAKIQHATCELALVHLADALNTVSDSSGAEAKRIKLDVMEIEYVERSTSYLRRMPFVTMLLAGLIDGSAYGSVPVVRA